MLGNICILQMLVSWLFFTSLTILETEEDTFPWISTLTSADLSLEVELSRIGCQCHLSVYDAMKRLVSSFILSRLDYCNSLKTGWIACREYKTIQLIMFLTDKGDSIQSLYSDPSTGCQSELRLSKKCSPCAIILSHSRDPSAPAYLSDHLAVYIPALCVPQMLVSQLFFTSN